jgi:hypothetical protein
MKLRLLMESGNLKVCLVIEAPTHGFFAMLNVISLQQFLLIGQHNQLVNKNC